MPDIQKSYKYVIESRLDQFTDTERIVAEYFINLKHLTDLSAEEITKMLGVSAATLSRFAKKCGTSGYREFVSLYKNSFVEKANVTSENNRLVLSSYQEILNRQYSLIDEAQIDRIANGLLKCRHLYIAGRGNSGLSAKEMASRFKWLGVDASAITDIEDMKLTTLFLKPDDYVLGLSISGKQKEMLYMLDKAREQGVKTILATANTNKILSTKVDELVVVPAIRNLNFGNLISPQLPMLLLGDMIYAAFVAINGETAKESQMKVRGVLYDE